MDRLSFKVTQSNGLVMDVERYALDLKGVSPESTETNGQLCLVVTFLKKLLYFSWCPFARFSITVSLADIKESVKGIKTFTGPKGNMEKGILSIGRAGRWEISCQRFCKSFT